MIQAFSEWWYAQEWIENGDELQIDPREAAQLAWAEAYRRATEEAARLCETQPLRKVFSLANLIRQAGDLL